MPIISHFLSCPNTTTGKFLRNFAEISSFVTKHDTLFFPSTPPLSISETVFVYDNQKTLVKAVQNPSSHKLQMIRGLEVFHKAKPNSLVSFFGPGIQQKSEQNP